MIITSIEAQKNPNRVNIYVDNSFALGISQEIRFKYGISQGMEVNDDFLNDILAEENFSQLITTAINYLSYRQRASLEIKKHLLAKGFNEDEVERGLDYLEEKGYLDDYNFARSFLLDKKNLNKFGRKRIEYELKLKGISSDIIGQVIDENLDQDEEVESCVVLANKKLPSYAKDDSFNKYRKLSAFLQRKGYDFSTIKKALNIVLRNED